MSKDQTEGFVCTNLSDDLSNLHLILKKYDKVFKKHLKLLMWVICSL